MSFYTEITPERVKQIARTVIREELQKQNRQKYQETQQTNPYPNAGKGWGLSERTDLIKEVRSALRGIAAAHGRTFGSIASKIRQMELLFITEED